MIIKNWNELPRQLTMGDLHGLCADLEAYKGQEITVSLVLGRPDNSEIARKLDDVTYIKTVHGLSILLEMSDYDNGEKISLLIPNVFKAEETSKVPNYSKYHMHCYNSLLDWHYFGTKTSFITSLDAFNVDIVDSVIFKEQHVVCRLYLKKRDD